MARGRKTGGRNFQAGQSGNPGGRFKIPVEIRDLARQYTDAAMHTLIEICTDQDVSASSRVLASQELLNRGWGKSTQHIEAKIGPLDNLSVDDQRTLLAALSALADDEGGAEDGARETTH